MPIHILESIPVGCVPPCLVAIIRCQYHGGVPCCTHPWYTQPLGIPNHLSVIPTLLYQPPGISLWYIPRYIPMGPDTRDTHPPQKETRDQAYPPHGKDLGPGRPTFHSKEPETKHTHTTHVDKDMPVKGLHSRNFVSG